MGGVLCADLTFEPLIEAAVEQYGVPLAQITDRPLWGDGPWVATKYLEVLCPEGRSAHEVGALVQNKEHRALVLETNDPDGAFTLYEQEYIHVATRLSVTPTVIKKDMTDLNGVLEKILAQFEEHHLDA